MDREEVSCQKGRRRVRGNAEKAECVGWRGRDRSESWAPLCVEGMWCTSVFGGGESVCKGRREKEKGECL